PEGTNSCRHTTDNSSTVRVTLDTSPAVAHAGIAESGGSLQTANRPATPSSVSGTGADQWPAGAGPSGSGTAINASPARTVIGSGRSTQPPSPTLAAASRPSRSPVP